jgi:glycosyltransferase involved in cell wall biosynthesis
MRVTVIICSFGRPTVLDETVQSVLNQTLLPEEILIACPSMVHVEEQTICRDRVKFIAAPQGLTLQRNTALEHVGDTDLIAFLDDDMELCRTYLERMAQLFAADSKLLIASGRMLADGGRGATVSRHIARNLCADSEARVGETNPIETAPLDYGYGCNMIIRSSLGKTIRFDENLALYAWLEDSDFSHRCTLGGKPPVINLAAACVHLGWRGGRISGRKMGYSQIVNPIYLWRKARVFTLRHLVVQYWLRCLAANLVGVFWGKPEEDRLNRLKGNLTGMWHLLNRRCDPSAINQLP